MKMNKGVLALAVIVAGTVGLSQVSAVFAQGGANEHSPVSASSVAISEATATATAQGLLAGTVRFSHLDRHHGTATWKIRIISTDGTQRGDFRINATTGAVVKSVIKPIHSHGLNSAARLADKLEKEKLHIAEKAHRLELKKLRLEQNK